MIPEQLNTVTVLLSAGAVQFAACMMIAMYFGLQQKNMRASLVVLQQEVTRCHEKRAIEQREIGELRARVESLQREIMRHVGAPPTVRFVVNSCGVIEDVGPNVTDIFGYEREDLLLKAMHRLIPREMRERHAAAFARRVADPEVKADPTTLRHTTLLHKTGAPIDVRIVLSEIAGRNRLGEPVNGKRFIANVTRLDPERLP